MAKKAEDFIGQEFTGTVVDYKYIGKDLVLLLEGEAVVGEVLIQQQVETKTELYCRNWHRLHAGNTTMSPDGFLRCMKCVKEARKRLAEKVRARYGNR